MHKQFINVSPVGTARLSPPRLPFWRLGRYSRIWGFRHLPQWLCFSPLDSSRGIALCWSALSELSLSPERGISRQLFRSDCSRVCLPTHLYSLRITGCRLGSLCQSNQLRYWWGCSRTGWCGQLILLLTLTIHVDLGSKQEPSLPQCGLRI